MERVLVACLCAGVACGPPPQLTAPAPTAGSVATVQPLPQPRSPAPAPRKPPPPGARLLRGFIELTLQPDTTILNIADLFGQPTVGSGAHGEFLFTRSLDGVAELSITRRHNQNRELLDWVRLRFPEHAEPTVAELAERLEVRIGRTVEVTNGCTDSVCSGVDLDEVFVAGAEPVRLLLALAQERFTLGNQSFEKPIETNDPRKLRVKELAYSILETTCPMGRAVDDPVALPKPSTPVQKLLAKSLLDAGRELSSDTYDVGALERALGVTLPREATCCSRQEPPFVPGPFAATFAGKARLIFEENSMTHITWVQYQLERDAGEVLFDVPGFRYVTDPRLLCHVWHTDKHVFELTERSDRGEQPRWRVFLVVSTDRDFHGGPKATVSFLSMERFPMGWPHIVL